MSTEIELRQAADLEQTPAPVEQHPAADLIAWAESARAANSIAESLARTSFVPAAFKGKPGEVTAAILTGNEMGLSPMASLRSFDLIQGTPAMRANAMRGVVQSHGHEIWKDDKASTADKVVMLGQRKGSDKVHRSEWTIERARGLQLLGKDNWKKQPLAMLEARATAEVCRKTASDVLYGVPYSSEELADVATEKKAATKRTVQRALQPVPAEPDFPEQAEPATEGAASDPWAADSDEQAEWPAVAEPGANPA